LEGFQDESLVRTLPCRHLFHAEYIVNWFLKQHNTCPIYKAHCAGTRQQEGTLPTQPPRAILAV
ncbi:hypothetical protein QBC40DRAFT_320799, partial [Triangularia verruculosa]